jgi:hypothetical protein
MDLLEKMIISVNRTHHKDDEDTAIIVLGKKGSGKSSLAILISMVWEYLEERKFKDGKPFNPENFSLGSKEFLARVQNAPQFSCLVGDEGIEIFFGRMAMSGGNKKQIQTFAQSREGRNHLYLINMTDLRYLESTIRTGGAECILYVEKKWDVINNRHSKGHVSVFHNPEIMKIKYDKDKGVILPNPAFRDTFPDVKKLFPTIWKQYKERSRKHKEDNRKQAYADWDKPKRQKTIDEIKRDLEVAGYVKELLKDRKLSQAMIANLASIKFKTKINTMKVCRIKKSI